MAPFCKNKLLQLNKLLAKALIKQTADFKDEVNWFLLQGQLALVDVLKGISTQTYTQLFLSIQLIICKMLLEGSHPREIEDFLHLKERVCQALESSLSQEKFEIFVQVNTKISHVFCNGSRRNLVSLLTVVSRGILTWENHKDGEQYFSLNVAISELLSTETAEKKIDLISALNLSLADIMAAECQNSSFCLLAYLNRIASLAIIDKCKNVELIFMAFLQLSEYTHSSHGLSRKDLVLLDSNLARVFVEKGQDIKFSGLIGWKLQLAIFMQKVANIPDRKFLRHETLGKAGLAPKFLGPPNLVMTSMYLPKINLNRSREVKVGKKHFPRFATNSTF